MNPTGRPRPEARWHLRLLPSSLLRILGPQTSLWTTGTRRLPEDASPRAFLCGSTFHSRTSSRRTRRRGAPLWPLAKIVGNDFFDIEAQAPGNPTKDQMRLMIQSLLAERFKLAVHFETRDAPVFALTLVKPGKTGPKLLPHSEGPPCPDYTPPELGAPPP